MADIGPLYAGLAPMEDKDLYAGLIRLHILHHAVYDPPIFGLGIIEELARHGYKLSPGTLYPLLHGLEERGYVRSTSKVHNGHARRTYRATARGRRALEDAKIKVRELFGELIYERRTPRAAGVKGPVTIARTLNGAKKSRSRKRATAYNGHAR